MFNSTDSAEIVQAVIDGVGNDIPAAVNATVAKKALFEEADQASIIAGTLTVLLYEHDTFSAALAAKISQDQQARATAVVAKIHNAIQDGIEAFDS